MNSEETIATLEQTIATTQKIIKNYNLQGRMVISSDSNVITIRDQHKNQEYGLTVILFALAVLIFGFSILYFVFIDEKPERFNSICIIAFCLLFLGAGIWTVLATSQKTLIIDRNNCTLKIVHSEALWHRYNSTTFIAFDDIARQGIVEVRGGEDDGITGHMVTIWTNEGKEIALMSFGLNSLETTFKNAILKIIVTTIDEFKSKR